MLDVKLVFVKCDEQQRFIQCTNVDIASAVLELDWFEKDGIQF